MQSEQFEPAPAPATSGPRRTHPLTAITGFVTFGFGLLLVITTAGFGFDLIITLFGAFSLVRWWFRTYDVGPDELIVRDGVLSRRLQVVPYRRVQQVDIRRSLLMQIFGLAALRIETAGSQAGTVDLAMLDVNTAESLRSWVLARRDVNVAPTSDAAAAVLPTVSAPEVVVVAIDGGRLLLAGATSSAVVMVGAVTAAAIPVAIALAGAAGLGAVPVSLFFTLMAATLGAILTVMQYGGYQLALAGNELRLTHGVLERRHVTMPRARVQHIEITDNPARRGLGVVSVSIHSAARVGVDRGGASGRLEIPIVKRSDIPGLLAALMGDQTWTPPALHPRPPAARRRGIVRRTGVPLALAAIVLAIEPVAGIIAIGCALLGIPWGLAAHRRAGYAVTSSITALAAGVLHHRLHLVPIARIQSARTTQSPFQRRVDLTTVAVDIAGSAAAPALYDLDVATASNLRRALPRGIVNADVTA